MLLPDIERGDTWTEAHRHRCLIRQILRWAVEGNRMALDAMKRAPNYAALREEADAQWKKGNRGSKGDWR